MSLSRVLARPLLASTFLVGGVAALRNAPAIGLKAQPLTDRVVPMAQKAAPASVHIPEDPTTLVRINAGVQIAGALALATGRFPRLSAAVLGASLVPTTMVGHRFWEEEDAATRQQQTLHFFKNVSLVGGLLIAAGDTDGKPGMAWRAGRAAKDARREGRRLAKDARREAKHLASAARREAKLTKAKLV